MFAQRDRLFAHEQPYQSLQRLKLRLFREEHRGRSVSLTCNAADLAAELWKLNDATRFGKGPDEPVNTPGSWGLAES